MGSLLAIPSGVDLTSLGLTPAGMMVARALRDYGAYVVDRSSVGVIYVEPTAPQAWLDDLRKDVPTLLSVLSLVTNNSPENIGGGGRPLAPFAPPLP
jgi:hypothetical protein